VALDVVQTPDGTWLRAGGTAANVAANLAYFGWRSGIVGQIGEDDAGELISRDLVNAGVDVSGLDQRATVGTPVVLHEVGPRGHRFQFGCRQCGRTYRPHRPVSPGQVGTVLERSGLADVFFFDRPSSAAIELASRHRREGRLVFYEPSSAARPLGHRRAAELAHIIKYSDERRPLFEQYLDEPTDGQIRIVTSGPDGLRFWGPDKVWVQVPAVQVAAVDAGGAGDWLTAALLTSLLPNPNWTTESLMTSLRQSQAIAALSCLLPGARSLAAALSPSQLRHEADGILQSMPTQMTFTPPHELPSSDRCPFCHLPLERSAS
jgi:sugar/nucleoside kinase (ribokinase family)